MKDNYNSHVANRRTNVDAADVRNRSKKDQMVNVRDFLKYDKIKDSIVYKLINTEKNKELLEDIPHMAFFDLSIIFQCLIVQEESSVTAMLIHNIHMKLWDVTVEELYTAAEENTQRLRGQEIKSMTEILCEIMKAENPEQFNYDDCAAEFSDSVPMYVLSNKNRIDGATCMLYPNLIEDFADAIGSSFYIIPSSIHELLLLPTESEGESGEIKSMIKEINDTQVQPEEVLSYSLYYYDREDGKISRL